MREDVPPAIQDEAQDLNPSPIVTLYRLVLNKVGGVTEVLFTPREEKVWLGETYESVPCLFGGVGQNADGENSRPRMTVANPDGLFSSWVQDGYLDSAILHQYMLLKSDLELNNDIKIHRQWRVTRVASLSAKTGLVFECRHVTDGHPFKLPSREFTVPEFPHVSLG